MPRKKPTFSQMLSPQERREYEELLTAAGYDEHNRKRPSGAIADRMHELLLDAQQAGRKWATWAIEDDARAGHLKRFTAWEATQRVVHTLDGDRIVTRRAVMALRVKDSETGEWIWRGEDLAQMVRPELEEVMLYAKRRRHSDAILQATVSRLLRLLDETGADDAVKVTAALEQVGMTIDEVLTMPRAA